MNTNLARWGDEMKSDINDNSGIAHWALIFFVLWAIFGLFIASIVFVTLLGLSAALIAAVMLLPQETEFESEPTDKGERATVVRVKQ